MSANNYNMDTRKLMAQTELTSQVVLLHNWGLLPAFRYLQGWV